jgi:RNA polymerase sigma-70 factor (ECF subfamily)
VSQPDPTLQEASVDFPLLAPPHLDRTSDPAAERASGEVPQNLLQLLYRQMRGLAGARPDLDDLVQAAAERALKSWSRFEGRSAVSTWTYGIAYRTLIDHDRWYHRWRKRFSFAPDGEPEQAHHLDAEGSLAELARARKLREVLEQLPPAKRAVVVLAELEGLSMKEVSEIVGVNERTVRSRLRDARQKLVELLADDPLFQEATA